MTISLPCTQPIRGDQLAAEIAAAGFTNVSVSVAGDQVVVTADELADPMPSAEERETAMEAGRQAALAQCLAEGAARAGAVNAPLVEKIAPVVAAHVPPPPPPPPTPQEKLAALGLTEDDLKALLA